MVPELIIAVLACARLGSDAPVIFGGFSAEAIRDRVLDAGATCVLTADSGYRRGKDHPAEAERRRRLRHCPEVKSVGRRRPRRPAIAAKSRCSPGATTSGAISVGTERRLSSGAGTGRASAVHPVHQRHRRGKKTQGRRAPTAGYGTQVAFTTRHIFDLRDEDTYFCTADVGWITGHSYIAYGPLSQGQRCCFTRARPTRRTRVGCGRSASAGAPPSLHRADRHSIVYALG